ncbi:MAG: cystathionine gamma-synthase [Chloroflexota bacterium]|nr:MAG: cystathionine gamma-synthase [Chloroflexota bacterium]UCF27702.1 MAG: cystathionine gamma-synthase [Chloroflexota bacterium]
MSKHIETLAIHAGQEPEVITGAVMTPIFQSSTYAQEGVGKHKGYEYSRTGNPTRTALEANLAALEGAEYGLAFASGMAATDAVLRMLSPGDHILAGNDVYGGTFRLFDKEFKRYGLVFSYVNTSNPDQVESGLRETTKIVWLETPTNPLLNITDLVKVVEILQSASNPPLLVVDNTFATPYLQRPIELGADVVVHSTTKYLGGHSDVIGGAVVTQSEEIYTRLAFLQNAVGAVPGPLDCFLVLRGLKTLPVRMDRHASNAEAIANYLAAHPLVDKVYYPFHISHPHREIAMTQMLNGGGMVSFVMKEGAKAAKRVAEGTVLFTLAESLGGVESLIEIPAVMTHASVSGSSLEVDPGLVRLSVGLEHVDDLLEDLENAFQGSN